MTTHETCERCGTVLLWSNDQLACPRRGCGTQGGTPPGHGPSTAGGVARGACVPGSIEISPDGGTL